MSRQSIYLELNVQGHSLAICRIQLARFRALTPIYIGSGGLCGNLWPGVSGVGYEIPGVVRSDRARRGANNLGIPLSPFFKPASGPNWFLSPKPISDNNNIIC